MDRSIAVRRCTTRFLDLVEDEDLFVEILKRLPDLKHIHRCKCVSKHWYKTISSDYFVRCYTKYKKPLGYPFGLFYEHVRGFRLACSVNSVIRGFSLSFLPARQPFTRRRVLSANNGLLLCCDVDATIFSERHPQYYVCNPLMKEWIKIPQPHYTSSPEWLHNNNNNREKRARIVSLLPVTSTSEWVFVGFIYKNSNFRIVCVPTYRDNIPFGPIVEIYASETGEWMEVLIENACNGSFFTCPRSSNSIACNGLLHWTNGGRVIVYDPYIKTSLCLSLKIPNDRSADYNETRDCVLLGECRGRLRCSVLYNNSSFTVWELKDFVNNGEWCLVQRVCLDQMTTRASRFPDWLPGADRFYRWLCFHPLDEDVVFLWQFHAISSCNMKTKTVEFVCDLWGRRNTVAFDPVGLPIVLPLWPISLFSCV